MVGPRIPPGMILGSCTYPGGVVAVAAEGPSPALGLGEGRALGDLGVLGVGADQPHCVRAVPPVHDVVPGILNREAAVVVVRGRKGLIGILGVHGKPQAQLLDIGQTARLARLLPCPCEHGEQDGGQDRDDRDHDEQFNQRETVTTTHGERLLWARDALGPGVQNAKNRDSLESRRKVRRITHPPPSRGCSPALARSSPDFRISLLPAPSRSVEAEQWQQAGFVPGYSCGAATAFHRLP